VARIIALGGGLVGRFVLDRLTASNDELLLIDNDPVAVAAASRLGIEARSGDAITAAKEMELEEGDTVVNMLPGSIGHAARVALVERGATIVDLAFAPEHAESLDLAARRNGAVLIHDVGIAPGLSNMLIAEAIRKIGPLKSATIKVGGNPSVRDADENGWSYMAPFSPADVIEEYTRPARIRRDGKIITVPALSDKHRIRVSDRGEMEAFLTDGLRSLLELDIPDFSEYTVRWPGHIDRWVRLFGDGIEAKAAAKLLEEWRFEPSRAEFTWLEVAVVARDRRERTGENLEASVEGRNGDKRTGGSDELDCQSETLKALRWTIQDDGAKGWSSMARTTGLVTETIARLTHHNQLNINPGVHSPETLPAIALMETIRTLTSAGVKFTMITE
jgi:hypothetical protein